MTKQKEMSLPEVLGIDTKLDTVDAANEVLENLSKRYESLEVASKKAIKDLVAQYEGLKIKDIEDKDGYNAVHKARMDLKNTRTSIEKVRKAHVKPFNDHVGKVNEILKGLQNMITPTETLLESQEKAIDHEKDRIKREKEEAEKKENLRKQNSLYELGFIFDGADYILRDEDDKIKITIDPVDLKQMEVSVFDEKLAKYKAVSEDIRAAKEMARKKAEAAEAENERLRKEIEDLKRAKQEAEAKDEPEQEEKETLLVDKAMDTPEDSGILKEDTKPASVMADLSHLKGLLRKFYYEYNNVIPRKYYEEGIENMFHKWENFIEVEFIKS